MVDHKNFRETYNYLSLNLKYGAVLLIDMFGSLGCYCFPISVLVKTFHLSIFRFLILKKLQN